MDSISLYSLLPQKCVALPDCSTAIDIGTTPDANTGGTEEPKAEL
jgi:hypothetical protein